MPSVKKSQTVYLLLCIFAFAAFVCPSQAKDKVTAFVESTKTKVTENFLDPDAAKFRKLEVREWIGDKDIKYLSLCGEVNAKNSLGAYTGYRAFYGSPESSKIFEASDATNAEVAMSINKIGLLVLAIHCGPETKLIRKIK